ncbi:MAG: hypothetical protein KAH32_00690, partial [Chlamydiia bacterium]|nr:hypothetical protein [Chlamydiia bacterium]
MEIKGKMNFEASKGDKFAKFMNDKLVLGDDILTNTEIVVYGYMLFGSYQHGSKRNIFKKSPGYIATSVVVDPRSVEKALGGLVEKKMLKKIKAGYEIIGERLRGDYVMVTKEFLISTQLTTAQKAFLLRVDALRREGLIKDNTISYSGLATLLTVSQPLISKTVKKLLGKDYQVKWIYTKDTTVVIDYDKLKESIQS